jgi:5,10-methylenetetrahydromethanopterin reductase
MSATDPQSMRFALFTAHDRALSHARAVWQTAERVGFDAIGVVDSPLLMRELFVSLAALALDTSRVQIFSCIMNTLTRDPTVTAGAYLGLQDLAPGRAFLAFGSGDSSTHGVGLGTAPLRHMQEYISAVRALLAGETASYQGRTLHGAWGDFEPASCRLFMAAHGPKALASAARVADGVICGYGVLPETIAHAEWIVSENALSVGRDPGEIEIWHVVYYCPADTVEEGFLHANGAGAAVLARSGLDGKLVPEHLTEAVRAVAQTWTLQRHARANQRTLEIARDTGCLEYLVARGGGMVGPVDGPAAIRELAARGVRNVLFVALGADKRALVQRLGAALAQVRGPLGTSAS